MPYKVFYLSIFAIAFLLVQKASAQLVAPDAMLIHVLVGDLKAGPVKSTAEYQRSISFEGTIKEIFKNAPGSNSPPLVKNGSIKFSVLCLTQLPKDLLITDSDDMPCTMLQNPKHMEIWTYPSKNGQTFEYVRATLNKSGSEK